MLQRLNREVKRGGDVLQEARRQHWFRTIDHHGDGGFGYPHRGVHGVRGGFLGAKTFHEVWGGVFRTIQARAKRRRALRAQERIGILTGGERGNTHRHPGRQEEPHRPQRRLRPRAIAIENEVGSVGIPLQERDVFSSKRRSLRGDRNLEPARVAPDDVDLPLAHDGAPWHRFGDVASRKVKGVERVGLLKDCRLGAVDVFPRVLRFAEQATREGDDAPLHVADREDDSPPEAVVVVPTFGAWRSKQSGRHQLLGREGMTLRPLQQRAMLEGRITDREAFGDLSGEVALLQVRTRLFRLAGL